MVDWGDGGGIGIPRILFWYTCDGIQCLWFGTKHAFCGSDSHYRLGWCLVGRLDAYRSCWDSFGIPQSPHSFPNETSAQHTDNRHDPDDAHQQFEGDKREHDSNCDGEPGEGHLPFPSIIVVGIDHLFERRHAILRL